MVTASKSFGSNKEDEDEIMRRTNLKNAGINQFRNIHRLFKKMSSGKNFYIM
jgi:hypothetical protein